MNKTLKISAAILSLSALTSLSFAAIPGSYVGGGLGYSNIKTPDQYLVTGSAANVFNQSRDMGGLGERAFAGYNFNEYFGIEGGYNHFAKSSYKSSLVGFNGINANVDYNLQDIDLVGKAYMPVYAGFNVYALGGVAYVRSAVDYTVNGIILPSGQNHNTVTTNKFRPTYGVGASYDIPDTQLTTNIEFSRVQGIGNVTTSNSAIPSANMVTFNLAYNFG